MKYSRRAKPQLVLPMQLRVPSDAALRGAFERAGLHRVGLHFNDVKGDRSAAALLGQLSIAYRQGDGRSADIFVGRMVRMRSRLQCGGRGA